MMAARVAGVPMPESFIASRSSSSSTSLPAVSIAPSSDASVYRRGGLVSFSSASAARAEDVLLDGRLDAGVLEHRLGVEDREEAARDEVEDAPVVLVELAQVVV